MKKELNSIDYILKANNCSDLFSNNPATLKEEYRFLSAKYHPDSNKDPRANEAMAKISILYDKAKKIFNQNIKSKDRNFIIKSKSGKVYNETFLYSHKFELGIMYITNDKIFYLLDSKNKRYFDNMIKSVSNIKYANDKMKDVFSKLVPTIIDSFEDSTGKFFVIVLSKTEDVFPLELFIKRFDGKLDPKHSAWIISRLCNICCFLKFQGITHNGISIQNLFVSPKFHSIMIYGGWWYTVPNDCKLIGTQKEIYDLMSIKSKANKVGMFSTDLECVKYIGRNLTKYESIPIDYRKFLEGGSSDDAIKEYQKWNICLDKSYGERKFIKIEVNPLEIYG